MPTFTDYRDKRVQELMEDELITEDKAYDIILSEWNSMEELERNEFLEQGFIGDEKKAERIIQSMKVKEKEIQDNRENKNYYDNENKIKVITNSLVLLQNAKTETQYINTEKNILLVLPKNCNLVKDFGSLIELLKGVESFSKVKNNILPELMEMEKLMKR